MNPGTQATHDPNPSDPTEKHGEPGANYADRLSSFSAGALDFEDVRALFTGLSYSRLGRRMVAELLPLEKEDVLARRQRLVELQGLEAARALPNLGGLTDPMGLFEDARRDGRPLDAEQLLNLRAFLASSQRLGEWMRRLEDDCGALRKLSDGLPNLESLLERIDRIIDERGAVRDDASPKLARLRSEIRTGSLRIDKLLRGMLQKAGLRNLLSDTSVHRRAGRSVLAVKAKSSGRVPGIVHDRSQTDQTVFIEPREVVEAGNRVATARVDERNEETRVLQELLRDLLLREADLRRASGRLGELELGMMCLGFCAQYGARPVEVAGVGGAPPGLLLRQAKHPLLAEQLRSGQISEVVPIDVRLGDDFDLLVITGPNTGGKTLALKTVGCAAICTSMGLPYPCGEGSRVPLYDGIAADIGDEQEIRQNLSTFASHLVRIRDGLARATERTLVLLDELGGGTDPDEGAALGDAVLEELLVRRASTLATTHLGKLKEFGYRHGRAENACVEFDVETLAPRYRLVVGTPGESSALVIAARLGVPKRVVEAARDRQEQRESEVVDLMADMRGARQAMEKARTEVDERIEDLERSRRELAVERDQVERKGELLEAEAQRDLEERVREARGVLSAAVDLLPQVAGEARERLFEALTRADGHLSGAALSERRQGFLAGLAKGQMVYIPRFKKRCVVHKVDRKKEEVAVKVGKLALRVSFDELSEYEGL